MGAALAVALIAGACSSDSESEPVPTVTTSTVISTTTSPATTTTTTSHATTTTTTVVSTETTAPDTTVTTAAETAGQPAGTLADLFVDESTTYQDVMDRISEDESACIKAAFGETAYGILLTRPVLRASDAERDPSAAARLFSCLAQDNVVLFMRSLPTELETRSGGALSRQPFRRR